MMSFRRLGYHDFKGAAELEKSTYRYKFIGGNLALDFVNTVADRFHPEKMEDRLRTVGHVRDWFVQASVVHSIPSKLLVHVDAHTVTRLRTARDHLHVLFEAVASGKPIPQAALTWLDAALRRCTSRRRLVIEREEVRRVWSSNATTVDTLLYPVLTAAADLITQGDAGTLRRCCDATCGWLFLDQSNARRRRWCVMADCGNRNKVKAHYQRQTVKAS
jgi:predicted RNA-binding Zn ribbon-like protein